MYFIGNDNLQFDQVTGGNFLEPADNLREASIAPARAEMCLSIQCNFTSYVSSSLSLVPSQVVIVCSHSCNYVQKREI